MQELWCTGYYCHIAQLKEWIQNRALLQFLQKRKISRLLKHITANIKFYQSFSGSFSELPIINKNIVQENFEKMNQKELSYAQAEKLSKQPHFLFAHQSVGTSCNAGIYLFTPKEAIKSCAGVLNTMLQPTLFKKQKVAFFHLSASPYFDVMTQFAFLEWQFFDLSQDFEQHLKALCAFSPDVIIAPVQTICMLAKLQQAQEIYLKPKKIITTSEVLSSFEERTITTLFEQNVHQLYQCAEGWLGTTCEYGTFHLREDIYFIEKEWIDKERFIPVITTLDRYVHPLVRYRMEDILVLKSKPCPCGSVMLAIDRIVGRCEDTFYFSANKAEKVFKPIYADSIHQTIMSAGGGIYQYQLIQHSVHHLVVKMKASNPILAQHSLKLQFEKLFQLYDVRNPLLEFGVLEEHPLNRMCRQIQRLI